MAPADDKQGQGEVHKPAEEAPDEHVQPVGTVSETGGEDAGGVTEGAQDAEGAEAEAEGEGADKADGLVFKGKGKKANKKKK